MIYDDPPARGINCCCELQPAPEPAPVAVTVATEGVVDAVDPERQRSLFSWAEFMAREQDERPKRQRRDEAPTLSLFEWALEQEGDGELVGAGH